MVLKLFIVRVDQDDSLIRQCPLGLIPVMKPVETLPGEHAKRSSFLAAIGRRVRNYFILLLAKNSS